MTVAAGVLLAWAAAVALHVGAMALAARLLGAGLGEVRIGVGPTLVGARLPGGGALTLGLLPVAGSVRFEESGEPRLTGFESLSRPRQLIVVLSGPAALLAAAAALLGPAEAVRAAGAIVGDVFGLVTGGPRHAAERFSALLDAARGPVSALVGLAFAKCAGLNLLPLPVLNGGQALLLLTGVRWSAAVASSPFQTAAMASVLLTLAVALAWLVAGLRWLL